MGARTRSRDERVGFSGTYQSFAPPNTFFKSGSSGTWETCDDVTGNFPRPNPFRLRKYTVIQPSVSGTLRNAQGNPLRILSGYPMGYSPAPPDPSAYYHDLDEVDRSNAAWDLLASTNVSAPHVSVPTFIYELRDLPEIVRGWGQGLLRDAAKGHLSWRWVVKPMISDLRKLFNFADAVERRRLQLVNLRNNRFLRSTAGLSQQSMTLPPQAVVLHSEGAMIYGWRDVTITEKIWGSVQWKLQENVSLPTSLGSQEYMAKFLTFGYTNQEALAVLWESMPWSWFVDWFAGIGDVIAATNNAVPMTWSNVCIMHQREAIASYRVRYDLATATWASLSNLPMQKREHKDRFVMSGPLLPVKISLRPLLSGSHWSILASLAALRTGRPK